MRALFLASLLAGCSGGAAHGPRDTGLDGLAATRVDPGLILPQTTIVVAGQSFVDTTLGATQLRLQGMLGGNSINRALHADVISGSRLQVTADDSLLAELAGADHADFTGQAVVEVLSSVDQQLHAAPPLTVQLTFATESVPTLDQVGDGVSFVNQPVLVTGDGFLLGGLEGETRAVLEGCFTPDGETACGPTMRSEIPGGPALEAPFDRTQFQFPYASSISGIGPGTWTGTLAVANAQPNGQVRATAPRQVRFAIQPPAVFGATTTAASLGQYVVIRGGGFVGALSGEATLLALKGTFAPDGGGAARPLDLELVTEFVSGPTVRYVLSDSSSDPLGQVIKLRSESGTITGTIQPIVVDDTTRIAGDAIAVVLRILPVKQVVWVHFLPSYVDSLRKFGLRAADPLIRARVLAVAARDYDGANIEFRGDPPDDFADFSTVDIAGPDPNGEGLLGYDNTPGKDTDNQRLYDHIGGVNAVTQEDGSPGYGGVFTESFFGFSRHPNGLAAPLKDGNTTFDKTFDPFRPDTGGLEVTASELAALDPPALSDGAGCPAGGDRRQQISCAVWVLGNVTGTTMTHEVGHSLGLANPYGNGYHDTGDLPNRLMEVGGARPFDERAELGGQGPALFCDTAFDYLRKLLPTTLTPPTVTRPPCDR